MNRNANASAAKELVRSHREEELRRKRDGRRSANRIRRLHHHAVRTDDMEATRRFYEDVLGMPMVWALRDNMDPTGSRGKPFLHCFFELGDGSCLAFFQFLPDAYGPATNLPRDGIDHHIAVSVADFDEIARLKARFDALGYPNCGIDHRFCYSFYVRDPSGMLLEFVVDAENELELGETAVAYAHDELAKWTEKDYSRSAFMGVGVGFPLLTSPAADILRVIHDSAPDPVIAPS